MDKTKYTNSELRKIAKDYGYTEVKKQFCHGQLIFTNGKYFISHDVDQHNGGFWKKAKTIAKLYSREARLGTYERNTEMRKGD